MTEQPAPPSDPDRDDRLLAGELRARARLFADETAARHLHAHPAVFARDGLPAELRCREDGFSHIEHLAAALATDCPQLFDDYVTWVRELSQGSRMGHHDLEQHLAILVMVIGEALGPDARAGVEALVTQALAAGDPVPFPPASHLESDTPLGVLASDYLDALLVRDRPRALMMVQEAAESGVEVAELYLHVFAPVLREVGRLWQLGEATVGQEHLVTAATQLAMARLYPRTFAGARNGRLVVVAAVGGELHEVGARMVADLFELEGWDSHFLGANTPTTAIVETVDQARADVLAISVTLPTHVPIAEQLIARCRELCPATLILVGGRPFAMVSDLWERLGADGTAGDARHAVQLATQLVDAS